MNIDINKLEKEKKITRQISSPLGMMKSINGKQ